MQRLSVTRCSFGAGPALSGTLVNTIGFEWMLFGIAILSLCYAPLLYSLKNPPTKEENKVRMKVVVRSVFACDL